MNTFKNIPIKLEISNQVESDAESMLLPFLNEMAGKLKTLMSSGQNGIFDLNREHLTSADIDDLRNILGRGEIDANLNTLGKTNIRETSIRGIWWITHYNEQGSVISECIEITTCPDLLKTFPDELDSALAGLQHKISEYAQRSTSNEVATRLNELGFSVGISQNN